MIVSIPSAGLRLHGALGVPADLRPGEKRSAFLVLHGFGTNSDSEGVRQPTRVLNEFGYVTLRFDMRGCGKSEGEFGRSSVSNRSRISATRSIFSPGIRRSIRIASA